MGHAQQPDEARCTDVGLDSCRGYGRSVDGLSSACVYCRVRCHVRVA